MPEDAPQPEPTIAPGAMPTTDPDAAAHAPHRTRARPGGGTIGAYTILGDKPLGSGGFGEVWLAERRTPYTQRVAIKIIKAGMDSREVIARFEQERQALAVMDHPSVAKVLDGGITPEGRPYFVMEYVRGEPITTFCDRHRLSLKQRLALFIPVCEAVQHAHLKGLIHRDLKPGNILVSFVENAGAAKRDEAKSSGAVGGMLAKVIDFGVAKATARTLTDKTIFTETGQMIGTPEYMSPEQAEMSGTDVDTRTDVYSLGVVLYELLVGLLPYDSRTLRSKGYDGIRKAIREGETPRPSTRLSGLKPDEAQHLAAARDLDVSHLVSELRREAEWIPLMALRKERDRRYQTPADLARDIGRYLEGSALVAGPESRWYKARKFAHRYRAPLAAVSVLALLLLGGFIAISLALAEAREQQRSADNERLRALAAQREAEAARGEAQSAAQAEAAQRVIVEQQAYEANILAAGAFITQNQGGAAVEALEACPLALRGWEWGWLMRRADQAAAVLGTGSPVNSATFSPDSRLIATASEDGRARIWNADGSGRSVALGVRGQKIAGALFSPDGKNVLTWSDEAEFSLWNAGTGEQVRTVDALHAVNTASFSPDGRFIVTAGADASARLWTSDGEPLRELKGHSEPIDVAAFSPDSTRVLTGSRDHTARVWRVSDGSLLAILGESSTGIEQGAFSPDGNSAITLSDRVRVWELRDEFNPRERLVQRDPQDSAKLVAELGEQGQAPSTAVFSRDGLRVIVGMYDGTIAVYGAKTGRTMRSLLGHVRSVSGIKPLKDNVHVATVGDDGTLRLWNADTAQLLRTFIGHASDIFALDVTSDGARAVTASYDGSVRLWNLGEASEDRQRTPLTLAHQKALLAPSCETALVRDGIGERRHVSLASGVGVALPPLEGTSSEWTLSSDGRTSAVALRSGAIALVDLETRRNTFTLDGHDGNVGDLAFSPDGKWLLSGGFSDKTIRLWNLETHQSVATREFDAVYNVGVSPDSKWAITAGLEHLTVFSLPTLEPVGSSSQAGASSPPFAFNPASNLLALVRFYDVVTLLRLPSAEVTLSLMLRPGAVGSLAFSPAGDRLLAASTDGALRVINVASPRAVFIDRVEPSETVAARYTPDGASIVLLTSHAAYRWGSSPRTWELQQRLRQEGRITREQQEAFVRDGVLKAWEIEPLPWVVDPAAPTAPSPSPSPRPSPPATAPPRSPPP